MKTFNSNKELKQELIKKLQHHQDLDTYIQGAWSDTNSGKGSFYSRTMQTDQTPIRKFSEKYNIDLWYCYLTERIFEGLPEGEYEKFPLESIKVLPVGADINKIKSLFHYRVLEDQLQFCKNDEKVTKSVLKCMELFKTPFDQIDEAAAWSAAISAAKSAAKSEEPTKLAAWSAARTARAAASAAMTAARLAAEAAEAAETESWLEVRTAARSVIWLAVETATKSVIASAAEATVRKNYYVFLKNTLIDCIKETY